MINYDLVTNLSEDELFGYPKQRETFEEYMGDLNKLQGTLEGAEYDRIEGKIKFYASLEVLHEFGDDKDQELKKLIAGYKNKAKCEIKKALMLDNKIKPIEIDSSIQGSTNQR